MQNLINDVLKTLKCLYRDHTTVVIYIVSALIVVNFFDVLFDLIVSILHTCFEWLEYGLEELIEAMFDTTRQQTQIIVFYLLLCSGTVAVFKVGMKVIRLGRQAMFRARQLWVLSRIRAARFWRRLSFGKKIKWIISGSASITLLAMMVLS
jgi:hypothetical protein